MQVPVVKAKRHTFPGIGLVKESDTFFHTDSTASPRLLLERGEAFLWRGCSFVEGAGCGGMELHFWEIYAIFVD